MEPNIDEMSLQEACDYAVTKIVEQGERSVCENDSCVYESECGNRCAVGWLLYDKELLDYVGSLGGLISSDIAYKLPEVIIDNQDTFVLLQLFHDTRSKCGREVYLKGLSEDIDVSNPVYAKWLEMGETV